MGFLGIPQISSTKGLSMIRYILVMTGQFLLIACLLAGCEPASKANSTVNVGKRETTTPANLTPNSPIDENSGKDIKEGGFMANLPPDFTQPTDDTGRKLLKEYGAGFLAKGGVTPPKMVVFRDGKEVAAFQASVPKSNETIGGVTIQLQAAAMQALKQAASETPVTPRGADAAARSYEDTVALWTSRVDPGLAHWSAKGRISAADAMRIRALSPFEQVPEILKLESQGIYFSKDLSKSIVYSVAPPGSSQHLSMLAVDVTEHDNAKARAVLAKHGWYQTVISDLPHFTFLGVMEKDLPKMGLKKVSDGGRVYWVPDI
jgi:hypothetical protein